MAQARQYVTVNVTVPAGTQPNAPQSTDPKLGDVWLYAVQVRIPNGHAGLTGLTVENAGASIVPWSPTPTWVVGNDDNLPFDVGVEAGASLRILSYNQDGIPHTFYLRFVVVPISQVSVPSTTPIQAIA